jgi:hypothetical protein
MNSKKLFYIDSCWFNLPDDFNGTITDALELLLQYRKQSVLENKINVEVNEEMDLNKRRTDNYNRLMTTDDIKCSMNVGMSQYNKGTKEWEDISQ